jgi:hypothetical protein
LCRTASRTRHVGAADEIEQVRVLGLVKLQRAGESLQHVFGHAGGVPALESRVVLDADPGQHRCLFASQAGDTTLVAVSR